MGIKSDAYLKSLYYYLGVKSKDEITNTHSQKVLEFIKNHPDQTAVKEMLLYLPNFIAFAKEQLEQMVDVSKRIIDSGDKDVLQITTIITSYNELLKNNYLNTDEKKRIIDLQEKYQKVLEEKLKNNDDLKKIIYTGAFTLAAISLFIVGSWVNTALGNKIDHDVLKEAAKKISEKS